MELVAKKDEEQQELKAHSVSELDPYVAALDVFRLVKTHHTPPFPNTYALWFSYISGSNPEIVAELDGKTKRGETISAYDINELCETYLKPHDREARQAELSRDLELGISKALQFFDKGLSDSSQYNDQIGEISESLRAPGSDPVELLDQLLKENEKMLSSSKELKECMLSTRNRISELSQQLTEVREESLRDSLTKVANRRAFNNRLKNEVKQSINTRNPLCLVLADIDHFKNVNDTYGHQAGDEVLRAFAALILANVKGRDTVARYGGEEFAIIMPETSAFDAHNLVTRIRHRWKDNTVVLRDGVTKISGITASFGIGILEDFDTPEDIISRTDAQLYEAKNAGRNLVKTEGL